MAESSVKESGGAGLSGCSAHGTTSADVTAVVKYVGDGRPFWIEEYSATTKSELPESSGEVESSWSRANCTTTAVATTVAKSVGDGEARPPGIAKFSATSKSELAKLPGELHDEAGHSWPRANDTSSAAVSAVAKLVDEARLPALAKYTQKVDVPVPHVKVLEELQRLKAQQRLFCCSGDVRELS